LVVFLKQRNALEDYIVIFLPEQLLCCANLLVTLPHAYSTTNYFPQQQLWHCGLVTPSVPLPAHIGLFNNKLLSPAAASALWPCEAISLYWSVVACCEGLFFWSSSFIAPTHQCYCQCMQWPIQQQTTFPSSSFSALAL